MKLLFVNFSPSSCYLISLNFKYFSQRVVFGHPDFSIISS